MWALAVKTWLRLLEFILRQGLQTNLGRTKAQQKTRVLSMMETLDTEAVDPFNPEAVLLNSVSVGVELDKQRRKES